MPNRSPSTEVSFYDLGDLARQRWIDLRDTPPVLYSTGLRGVDELLRGGLAPGELCLVAALTSHGKTAFLLNLAYNLAFNGIKIAFLTEEMTTMQLADRMIGAAVNYPSDVRRDYWEDSFDQLVAFQDVRAPMLVTPPCRTADGAVLAIKQATEVHGAKVVFVDFLQRLRGKGEDAVTRVIYTSSMLATAAIENNIPIVAGAQYSRKASAEKKFIPRLDYLRGASNLEQDASVVLMLCWPWMLNSTAPKTLYHCYCQKNRNRGVGGRGCADLFFESHRQRILDQPQSSAADEEAALEGRGTEPEQQTIPF